MKERDPESYAEAVATDKWLRGAGRDIVNQGLRTEKFKDCDTFIHHSCLPLDLAVEADERQTTLDFSDNECEGMCGV